MVLVYIFGDNFYAESDQLDYFIDSIQCQTQVIYSLVIRDLYTIYGSIMDVAIDIFFKNNFRFIERRLELADVNFKRKNFQQELNEVIYYFRAKSKEWVFDIPIILNLYSH